MKTTIYARVVAKARSFPDVIELEYVLLDENDTPTGQKYVGVEFSWEEVQHRFYIDPAYAKECEGYFADGDAANLGNKNVTITDVTADK